MHATAGTILASGFVDGLDLSDWHNLSLSIQGQQLVASVDGRTVVSLLANLPGVAAAGMASLRSGWHHARFDDLRLDGPDQGVFPYGMFDKHLLSPPAPAPGGRPDPAVARTDFTGLVGCAVTIGAKPVKVTALGRFAASHPSGGVHQLHIYDASTNLSIGQATVDLSMAAGGDLNGYAWGHLTTTAPTLQPGRAYYIMSGEISGGDAFFDKNGEFGCAIKHD